MDPTTILVVAIVAVVALGIGIAVDRWLLPGGGRSELEKSRAEAQHLLAEAKQQATAYREEHIDKAKAALALREKAFEEEREETQRALRRSRQKAEQRLNKLNRRTQRINDRESALHKASEAIEALRQEAKETGRHTKQLHARAEALLQNITTRREELQQQEQELAALKKATTARQERLDHMIEEQIRKLEQVSGMTQREAHDVLPRAEADLDRCAGFEIAQPVPEPILFGLIEHVRTDARDQAAETSCRVRDERASDGQLPFPGPQPAGRPERRDLDGG